MQIGVDLDEVGYPFVNELREAAVRMGFAERHTMPPATCWEFYASDWGWTTVQFVTVLQEATEQHDLYASGHPTAGFVEGMRELVDLGHSLHIVTDRARFGRPGQSVAATQRWLHDYGIPYDSLIFARDKTIARVDVHLDDAPHHYQAMWKARIPCYLYTADHNVGFVDWGHRVWSFYDFVRRIKALDNKGVAA